MRESRGISLEEISKATRIGKGHVEALEGEDIGALPAPVFVKGFIRAYCRELHAPEDEAVARYRELVGEAPPAARPPQLGPRSPGGHRSTLTITAVLMVVLAGALVLLTGRGPRLGDIPPGPPPPLAAKPADPAPPAPAVAAPPAPTPAPAATPAPTTPVAGSAAPAPLAATTAVATPPAAAPPAPAAPAAAPPPAAPIVATAPPPPVTPAASAGVRRLQIHATERTWVRVQADGESPRDATLEPGTTREWTATKRFLLTVGNAGGLELTLDGRRLAPLGARGAVIRDLVLPEAAPGAGS